MSKKVVLAFSGGLDTSYCVKYLSVEKGMDVHAVTVNTGGFTEKEKEELAKKAKNLGASSYKAIEATKTFYDKAIRYLIFGNVLKNNTYPLSVSAERVFQALLIAEHARELNADAIAHGSTGAGNDQVRFDMIFQSLCPDMEIITPIRDNTLSREAEIDYLKQQGVAGDWSKSVYSINQGLWGTSVGGKETLGSELPLPEEAFPSALSRSMDESVQCTIRFESGQPIGIDDFEGDPVTIIQKLNALASEFAIGRDIHVGDTIIGIKGRVGFEAAGPLLLIKAHHLLEKHVLTKHQLLIKDQLSMQYGHLLHEGQYLEPVMRDLEAFLESSQKAVTGEVDVKLLPYRYQLLGIRSENDLMNSTFGKYGEENKAWNSDDVKGFIKIFSNQSKIYQSIHNGG